MSDDITTRRRKLAEYVQDPKNANKGSDRSRRITRTSLEERGAGRSLLAAADDVFLAGNQTAKLALEAGITEVIEIETEGDVLIVHKRRDLQSGDEAARLIALEDNRARDHSEWDAEVVLLEADAGLSLEHLFRMDELEDLRLDVDVDKEINAAVDDADADGESGSRLKKDVRRAVKPVLYADQVAVFERALRATGIVNRGDALIAVCQAYLDQVHAESI